MSDIEIVYIRPPFEFWKWKCHDCGETGQGVGKPVMQCSLCPPDERGYWEIEKLESDSDPA